MVGDTAANDTAASCKLCARLCAAFISACTQVRSSKKRATLKWSLCLRGTGEHMSSTQCYNASITLSGPNSDIAIDYYIHTATMKLTPSPRNAARTAVKQSS